MSIHVVARIRARPDQVAAARQLLLGLVAPTRREAGCLRYELLQCASDPTDFTFVEEWRSEAALQAHLQSLHVQAALKRVPELVAADPQILSYRPVTG